MPSHSDHSGNREARNRRAEDRGQTARVTVETEAGRVVKAGGRGKASAAIYVCFANADCQARHRDDKDQRGHEQPDQDSETPEPPSYSSTPVDLITAVHNICERSRLNAGIARSGPARDGRGPTVAFGHGEGEVE